MKLRIFQAGKGDCLLMSSAKGAHILIDGGMPDSYKTHIAPALAQMRKQGQVLDLVCVSHIDQDHIGGILELLRHETAWRVHDYQKSSHGTQTEVPKVPRPPPIRQFWHNAFSSLIGENRGPIESMLAHSAAMLSCASRLELQAAAAEHAQLAQSVNEALRVSRLVSAEQLNIPLNRPFGGQLAMVREPAGSELQLGGLRLSVIGPFQEDLSRLRDEWNVWLREHTALLRKLRELSALDLQAVGTLVGAALEPLTQAVDRLGDRRKVTTPNLASLMLLIEEQGKTVLLTGDGHCDDILSGLEYHGKLDTNGAMHVDLLKVQHHGSEHNWSAEFAAQISADRYLFCGNGSDENPDLNVVDSLCDSIAARPGLRTSLLFNSSSETAPNTATRKHMLLLEKRVAERRAQIGSRLKAVFNHRSYFDITI